MKKVVISVTTAFIALFVASSVHAEELAVSGNGGGSQNQINVTINSNTTTQQTNQADVQNTVSENTNTGDNSASSNTGSAEIETGDAYATSQIDNTLNSNTVSDPCCNPQGGLAQITGNGSDSQNNVNVSNTSATLIVTDQNASITNTVTGFANTGGNTADDNDGDVSIHTGSIHVVDETTNEGINVFHISGGSSNGDFSALISGNGSGSTNTISSDLSHSLSIFVNSSASIANNSHWDLATGNNSANGNIGNVDIQTGDIIFDSVIKNGPINFGVIAVTCCNLPTPPAPIGRENPNPSPSPITPITGMGPASSPQSSTSGGDGESDGVDGETLATALGNILPTTGSPWMFLTTIGSVLMFFMGWYLRFRSGNAPPRFIPTA